jgi:regulator of protease activity HflC (stomatin/prohibitin superfamily)
MRLPIISEILILVVSLSVFSCNRANQQASRADQVSTLALPNVRLGDGVPMNLNVWVRWKIEKPSDFFAQFSKVSDFNQLVLYPRALELSNSVANNYPSVDSVYDSQRETFLAEIKQTLRSKLGESTISIKEVTIGNLSFPKSYTDAMEAVGMKRQHLEGIRNQNEVDLEQAAASKKKADADAQVAIAQAEAQAKLARIEAKTEEAHRSIELARAETAGLVSRRQAQASADSARLVNKAEMERLADVKNLEVEKRRNLDDLDIDKKRKERKADMESQLELAGMVQNNPNFASFLINKELASKVDIAVLPTGADASMLGGFWQRNKEENKGN